MKCMLVPAICGVLLVSGMMLSQERNSRGPGVVRPLFETSDRCMACHNGLSTPEGLDVSIGTDWRTTMMANAARDPYWHAAVRSETLDHPAAQAGIEDECAVCHMPMAALEHRAAGQKSQVFGNLKAAHGATRDGLLAIDGVSCTACHQISDQGLGTRESFTGGFAVDLKARIGSRRVFGPYEIDPGRTTVMRSSSGFEPGQASHLAGSELCASCHTLYTRALDESGKAIGELPEQVPYPEWRHSGYRRNWNCQSCHLPKFANMPVTSVLGQPRDNFSQHVFRAGNFFIPRVFARCQNALGLSALSKQLSAVSEKTSQGASPLEIPARPIRGLNSRRSPARGDSSHCPGRAGRNDFRIGLFPTRRIDPRQR
jgi:hypothetical protein